MSPTGAAIPFGGVVTVPASSVHLDIKRQVAQALEGVKPGQTMAVLNVRTGAGVNLALAHRLNNAWTVEMYIGKSGWLAPVTGGATVSFSR